MNIQLWLFRAWFFMIVTSLIIYAFVIYKMSSRRLRSQFDSSYFTLWKWLGVADCTSAVLLWTFNKSYVLFESSATAVDPFYSIGTLVAGVLLPIALADIQFVLCVVLAVNRLSCVTTPMRHNQMWNRKNTRNLLFVVWIIPIVLCGVIFSVLLYGNETEDLLLLYVLIAKWITLPISLPLTFICFLSASVVNLLNVYKLFIKNSSTIKSLERNLSINSLIMSTLMLLSIVMFVLTAVGVVDKACWVIAGDVFTVSNPMVLLMLSRKSRRAVIYGHTDNVIVQKKKKSHNLITARTP